MFQNFVQLVPLKIVACTNDLQLVLQRKLVKLQNVTTWLKTRYKARNAYFVVELEEICCRELN